MGYLFCDDLVAPIEESIGKERIEEILKYKDFGNKSNVIRCVFTVNTKDCPFLKGKAGEVSK